MKRKALSEKGEKKSSRLAHAYSTVHFFRMPGIAILLNNFVAAEVMEPGFLWFFVSWVIDFHYLRGCEPQAKLFPSLGCLYKGFLP